MRGRAWLCALMVLALALTAPGCSRRIRWSTCRDFWSLTAVTEQVFTT